MPSKLVLLIAVLSVLTAGHAPRIRELRNPDAEGTGRVVQAVKRASDL